MQKKISLRIRSLLVLIILSLVIVGCPPPIPPVSPTVTTTLASSITASSVTTGGSIAKDGGAAVIEKGICWNTTAGPTIDNNPVKAGNGLGNFSITISGLNPGITYYVRAYATNSEGTAYGNEVTFTTPIVPSTITTIAVSAITGSSASSGGNITIDGGGAVTARGVCWGKTTNPTIDLPTKTSDGIGVGSFVSLLSALTPGTKYYVRAYATNYAGTAYGNEVTFASLIITPIITAASITLITATTASSGGNITFDGGASVTARGICWSTTFGPTIANSKTSDGNGIGSFTSLMTNLSPNTTYYVRGYATNSAGTAYTDNVTFKTLPDLPTDADGNIYKTVTIGTQTWFAENLKTTKYMDNTVIPLVTDNNIWSNLTTPGYCWYNNDATNKSTYGALYNWYTVNTGKLCPSGWRVPSDADWTILTTYLGGEGVAGVKLKETGTSHWTSPNTSATNTTGFTAVPGGFRNDFGTFLYLGSHGGWGSSTEDSTTGAWCRGMGYNYNSVNRIFSYKKDGLSVRCMRNF